MTRKYVILALVLGMTSTAGATLSLSGDLTLSSAGDTGTIQVVSDAPGGYGVWIELVDISVAFYDGAPEIIVPCVPPNTFPPSDGWYGTIIIASLDPDCPVLAGVHINVNLIGIAEGVTTLNLYAEDGVTLLDSATITVLPETDCFPPAHPDYSEWVNVDKPDCWCYPRQCHGDADGLMGGSAKTGFYAVGPGDLNILIAGWLVFEPLIFSIPNGICADFGHDWGGCAKCSFYRVGPTDLGILIANWLVKEPPFGPGVPPDCLDLP
ncbi:MAG: hypothetical protein ACYSUY_04265 [Planctomycetota bacterium]|jgi:hypothetical protein